MNLPKTNNCPNCGNNTFGALAGDGTPYAILTSATKDHNGKFIPNHTKVLGVFPIICDKCNYVMLFKEN